MPKQLTPEPSDLFLSDDKKRADLKPSVVAQKSLVRSPPNLANYDSDGNLDPVVAHVLKLAQDFLSAYQNQNGAMYDKWDRCDQLYWMAQKESRMPELTLAKVSSSIYYRTARRLADGALVATFQGTDLPVKYQPDVGVFDPPETKQRKAIVSEGLNRYIDYNMRKADVKTKADDSFNWTYKYGNHIVYVPYDFEVERVKKYTDEDPNEIQTSTDGSTVYKHKRTGAYSVTPHPPETYEVEYDKVTKDNVGYYPRSLDQVFLDNRIPDLDRQTCLLDRGDITRPEIWAKAKAGVFKNINRISQMQQFQQYDWTNQMEIDRINNSGKVTTDSYMSEMYEHWMVWITIPKLDVKINNKGEATSIKWDQDAAPRRYVMHVIGRLNENSSVVVRFSESPYWSNGVPYIASHSHADDSGFYHRGLLELLDDNILEDQVAKGQLIDNGTLQNRRPIIRVVGRCRTKDMRIGVNKVFDVTSRDALDFLQVNDLSLNILKRLEYLKKDSEDTAQTPPFMLGEGVGGRASATEFATIRDQSSTPALKDIKSLNLQLMGGYARKCKEYAPQFLDKELAVDIDGPNGEKFWYTIHPDDFNIDLDIQEIAVQEFQNKATARQLLLNLTQLIASPAFAPFINVVGFLERVFSTFSDIFPNPEEILNKDEATQALMYQYLAQAPAQGSPAPGMMAAGQPSLMGMPTAPQGLQLEGIADASALAATGGQTRGV